MKTINIEKVFYSKEETNKQMHEKAEIIQSSKIILSFWASDSVLAIEYFHRKLNFLMLEFIEYGDGLCTMCFTPCEESPYLFYIHFNKDEEIFRLDELPDESEDTNTALHLIPTNSPDVYACDHLCFHEY